MAHVAGDRGNVATCFCGCIQAFAFPGDPRQIFRSMQGSSGTGNNDHVPADVRYSCAAKP